MNGRKAKKLRQLGKRFGRDLLSLVQRSPFRERFRVAWSILFPGKVDYRGYKILAKERGNVGKARAISLVLRGYKRIQQPEIHYGKARVALEHPVWIRDEGCRISIWFESETREGPK